MKRLIEKIVLSAFIFALLFSMVEAQNPLPNHRQLVWQEAELVALFHYDIHVFDTSTKAQHHRLSPQPDHNIFSPENLDTDQWIRTVKSMGAKIAILTVTHETGFALYQSDVNPYCLKAVKWKDGKGDIVRDFVESCRKYGILPGIYVGFRWNAFYGIHNFRSIGEVEMAENRQEWYKKMVEGMLEELFTRYGELSMVWFDGGASHPDLGAPDVLSVWKKYQPNCVFYHNNQYADIRWGGSETGTVPYPSWSTFSDPFSHSGEVHDERLSLLKTGDPEGKYWMPAMSDAPLRGHGGRHDWFWVPDAEKHIEPLEDLMDMYYKSVGHNSTLVLGVTPDPSGLVPKADSLRLSEFGNEIRRRFSDPGASTQGNGKEITLSLNQAQRIDHIVLMEDISKGERVREFMIEGKLHDKWATLYQGTNIGHKHIIKIPGIEVKELRLKISDFVSEPNIKSFQAFEVR